MLINPVDSMTLPLPSISSVEDCAEFAKTVGPFVPQLRELPSRLWECASGQEKLLELYVRTNPLVSGFAFSLFAGLVFLVVSEMNKNYSQIDRMWGVLPTIYTLHVATWAHLAGLSHNRVDVIAAFTTIWTCRLTYNYWRRGGYQIGSQDYRWAIVRNNTPAPAFFLLNVTFISFIQSVLLFLISAPPTYAVLLVNQIDTDTGLSDYFCLLGGLAFVLAEWISDGQQWKYQNAKRRYQKDAKVPHGHTQADLDRGFVASGLWSYSRHPNFAAEQLIWFVLYQWGCFASNVLFNWTLAGPAALVILFQGSTWLTESITADKYPEYAEYQKRVGKFFPTSPRPYTGAPDGNRQIRKEKQK